MQQFGLNNPPPNAPQGFWARQFQSQPTGRQKVFDWIFGIVLPVICFVFDPIVFKGGGVMARGGLLANYKPFAYILCFVSIMAMAAWLVGGARLKWLSAFFAGLFIAGAVVSLIVGAVLFPFSLMGLLILIGALGFTPLLTGIVYLRNGWRALQTAKPHFSEKLLTRVFLLTVIFSAVVPYAVNAELKRLTDEMQYGDAQTIRRNGNKLKYVAPLIDLEVLRNRYYNASTQTEKTEEIQAVVEVYRALTGRDVEVDSRRFD